MADGRSTPVVCNERVGHGGHGDEGEESGRDTANAVTKVEQANGETAKNDGEIEPREEGSLVGEKDLGLNTSGECNTLSCKEVSLIEAFGGCILPGAAWSSGAVDMMISIRAGLNVSFSYGSRL